MTDEWTLEELVRRVADALAADEVRAPNGRVREVPDARAIRWYTTIGLLDRPARFRGRTALYGERHLLQVVAVKRRQAQGLALAEIQAELAGATDAALRRVARIPGRPPASPPPVSLPPAAPAHSPSPSPAHPASPLPPGSPVARPSAPAPVPPATLDEGEQPVRPGSAAPAIFAPLPARTPRPAPPAPPARAPGPTPRGGPARRDRFWATPPAGLPATPPAGLPAGSEATELRYRVVLPAGVALDLPSAPSSRDLADITAAAQPLLRLLAERGLLTPEEPSNDDH
ncbi:hypothetical protein GCM10023322_40400 [Rugosimonospora acidiphila]|uniref:HTH merR-type domain-containing protein n=1 Tax=Rugosimonospora acidiphila TaxID=556531 RepID=A0ABP9RXW4_9ACTN